MLEFAPRARRYGARVARLLNIIGVPAPVLPPIETCGSIKASPIPRLDENATVEPKFELFGVPISLIFEVYLIL